MIEKESDLYEPVRLFLEKCGYRVNGEVKGCDIAAVLGDELVVCELKKSFNLKLVYQLMERKKLTPAVYAVIPRPKSFTDKKTVSMLELLKAIGAGLIVVSEYTMLAEAVLLPNDACARATNRRTRAKNKILAEVDKRVTNTAGGINKTEIMTLYKESSLAALCYMRAHGSLKTRYMRTEIANAVKSNYFGWFERLVRGEYIMSAVGRDALDEYKYKEVIKFYETEVDEKCLKSAEMKDAGAAAAKNTRRATRTATNSS